jgi:site-specific recombinase XerD
MNDDILTRYAQWLSSSDRLDSTIRLRMSHMLRLASTHDLTQVTGEDLERIQACRRKLASETRKSQLSSWRLFFGWAVRRGIRPDDPTVDLDSIRVRIRAPHLAPDEDVAAALDAATPAERAMILLGRGAWLRLSEITTLHTRDRQGRVLVVRGKGDHERIVPLNDDVYDALILLERTQGRGYYFPGGTDGHLHPMSVNKIITRRLGHNPHSLRHAGATAGFRQTRNIRATQVMLGHASVGTTQRYTHLSDDELQAVADASRLRAA